MSTLRIRIELNKGGDGAPLNELISVAKETEKFLRYLAEDYGIAVSKDDWVAHNFKNESVMFDAETERTFSTEEVKGFTSGLFSVTEIDPKNPKFEKPVKHRTVAQYAKIGEALPPARTLALGIFRINAEDPVWRGLSHRDGVTLREKIDQTVTYIGSVQGRIHSHTFEGEKLFYLRANRYTKLIRCDYPDHLYSLVHSATEDAEGFVTVRGRITARTVDREIAHIEAASVKANPPLSDDRYHSLFGANPGYTGDLSTEEAVDNARSSDV